MPKMPRKRNMMTPPAGHKPMMKPMMSGMKADKGKSKAKPRRKR